MWNVFKVNNKNTRTMPLASFWCISCYPWTHFTSYSIVSIANFEHAIADWGMKWIRQSVTAWKVSEFEVHVFGQKLNLRFQSDYEKKQTRNKSEFGHFSPTAEAMRSYDKQILPPHQSAYIWRNLRKWFWPELTKGNEGISQKKWHECILS